jgi:hypothetical protein
LDGFKAFSQPNPRHACQSRNDLVNEHLTILSREGEDGPNLRGAMENIHPFLLFLQMGSQVLLLL